MDAQDAAIAQTVQTPGWAIIKQRAFDRIQLTKQAALLCQNETELLQRYRIAWAAEHVLSEFLAEVVEEKLPVETPGEFYENEAQF